jgi:hypothetical protein
VKALAVISVVLVFSVAVSAQTCGGMSVGPLAGLNGFVPFTAGSLWNTDITNATVDPSSTDIINYIGSSKRTAAGCMSFTKRPSRMEPGAAMQPLSGT